MMTQTRIEVGWGVSRIRSLAWLQTVSQDEFCFSPDTIAVGCILCSQVFAQQQVVADAIFCDLDPQ